jgi:hypothetical protein
VSCEGRCGRHAHARTQTHARSLWEHAHTQMHTQDTHKQKNTERSLWARCLRRLWEHTHTLRSVGALSVQSVGAHTHKRSTHTQTNTNATHTRTNTYTRNAVCGSAVGVLDPQRQQQAPHLGEWHRFSKVLLILALSKVLRILAFSGACTPAPMYMDLCILHIYMPESDVHYIIHVHTYGPSPLGP